MSDKDDFTEDQLDIVTESNFAVVKRWQQRKSRWKKECPNWKQPNDLEGFFENESLEMCDKSILGGTLIQFRRDWEKLDQETETLGAEITALTEEIEALENEIVTLRTKITKTNATLKQDQNLSEQFSKLMSESISQNEYLISKNESLILKNKSSISKNESSISDKKNLILEKKNSISSLIENIFWQHQNIMNTLSDAGAQGNETAESQGRPSSTLSSIIVEGKLHAPKRLKPSIDTNLCAEMIRPVNQDILRDLQALKISVAKIAKKAPSVDSQSEEKIKNTCENILSWPSDQFQIDQCGWPSTNFKKETKIEHPTLQALVCRILAIINEHTSDQEKMDNSTVASEQELWCGEKRRRRLDMIAQKHQQRMMPLLPSMVDLPIEIKRFDNNFTALQNDLEKGQNQITGHLARRLMHSFNMFGIGVDADTVGICLTPYSIEVFKMSLVGVGTEELRLLFHTTGCHPLLGYIPTNDVQNIFIQNDGNNNVVDGFSLLAGALLHEGPNEYKSMDVCITTSNNVALDEKCRYLGSGAFSNVIEVNENEFLKLPKSEAYERVLEEEARILELIDNANVKSIPQKLDFSDYKATIRGEISTIKGLRLRGIVGRPLDQIERRNWEKYRKTIIERVVESLGFAHRKNIFHLDVRPGNIIFRESASGRDCHVLLSDWGCSSDGRSLNKFRGCAPYAHNHFFFPGGAATVKLEKAIDFASLAYTVYHVENGRLPWLNQFARQPSVTDNDLKFRWEQMEKWLRGNNNGLNEKMRKLFLAACNP